MIFFLTGAWRQQSSASVLNTFYLYVTVPRCLYPEGTLSLSEFVRVVDHASCFHLHSFPDFLLTQLTAAIIQQHHLRLWPSESLSAPPPVPQSRSEIMLPSPSLGYNALFMCFQMLCGWADITHRYLDRSGSHPPRKMNRLRVTPAPLELCVCVHVPPCPSASSAVALPWPRSHSGSLWPYWRNSFSATALLIFPSLSL